MLKRLVVFLTLCVLAIAACETVARWVYGRVQGQGVDFGPVNARKRELVAEAIALGSRTDPAVPTDPWTLHPYLGVVRDPAVPEPSRTGDPGLPVSPMGFLDDKSPILAPSPREVVVGVFGGAVAWRTSKDGASAIEASLARVPSLRGRKPVFVRAAIDGGKQPQQLLAFAWLLSLGAHFDAIVEIDGFDEAVVPLRSNLARGVDPTYPGGWDLQVAKLEDPVRGRLNGEIATMTRLRGWWAETFLLPPLRSSAIATLVWRGGDDAIARKTIDRRMELADHEGQLDQERKSFARNGPERTARPEEAQRAEIVRVWRESSLQMHRLAAANGILYFHFLQPTPHFPGSKPMGEAERRAALREGGVEARAVAQAYPMMRDASLDLREAGVRFHDLSGAFQGIEAQVYLDPDGRVNERGAAILGRRVGEAMTRDWAGRDEVLARARGDADAADRARAAAAAAAVEGMEALAEPGASPTVSPPAPGPTPSPAPGAAMDPGSGEQAAVRGPPDDSTLPEAPSPGVSTTPRPVRRRPPADPELVHRAPRPTGDPELERPGRARRGDPELAPEGVTRGADAATSD
ncbi:MAG: hypothetical protein ACKOCT_11650 [Alphaproteobacteria bacterium]